MKKRILKTAALVTAIVLIGVVAWFANALVGNPISKLAAANTAEKRLEEKYADQDYVIEKVVFNFKNGCYNAFITSPSSADSSFNLLIDGWGNLIMDSYEDRVTSGLNTADRIRKEYRNKVDAVFDSQAFPYAEDIGYGDIAFTSRRYKDDPSVPRYALITEELTRDALYDVNELGGMAGKLTVYLEDTTVSYERLAEVILDIKRIFDDAGVKFHAMDLVLRYPKNEDGVRKEGRVEVQAFPYEDMYGEGMVERVRASDEAAGANHEEQDGEKRREDGGKMAE